MRASTARLTNSPVRLADLQFPQVNRLIHRTRLAFIHLDNLLAYAKRDRDGRIDGYLAAHLPDECVLLFFRKGEAVNAASLHTAGRHVITITEGLKRMRAEVERSDLPAQAATALVSTYRELYWRIVDAVEREFPGEAKRRAQKVMAAIVDTHQALALLSVPRGTDTPDAVVRPEELATALTDWALQLLEGAEVMMPGTALKVLKDATREHRYVLQAAGFYGRLPWRVTW